jgi:hypothetical protein
MDDLTLLRDFRAERADDDPRARAEAWLALEARLNPAPIAHPASPARSPRRGVLALAGVGAIAAIVAGILVLSSGPTAQPATAEVLHGVATVAAGTQPQSLPEPGQYLYRRTKTLELQGWIPGTRRSSMGGIINRPDALAALVPVEREFWMSPEGSGRSREVLGTLHFISDAEKSRWEAKGSPLPGHFNADGRDTILGTDVDVLEASGGVIDIELPDPPGRGLGPNFGFPDVSGMPTEPEALRLTVQDKLAAGFGKRPLPEPIDTENTIIGLWGILQQPVISPKLRAAAFNALAELPGIELDRDATDLVGRPGYAISFVDQVSGIRNEYIFDPETSEILGENSVLAEPGRSPGWDGIPADTTIRETAYLRGGVVDSTRETPEDKNGGPVATTSPVYRK